MENFVPSYKNEEERLRIRKEKDRKEEKDNKKENQGEEPQGSGA